MWQEQRCDWDHHRGQSVGRLAVPQESSSDGYGRACACWRQLVRCHVCQHHAARNNRRLRPSEGGVCVLGGSRGNAKIDLYIYNCPILILLCQIDNHQWMTWPQVTVSSILSLSLPLLETPEHPPPNWFRRKFNTNPVPPLPTIPVLLKPHIFVGPWGVGPPLWLHIIW